MINIQHAITLIKVKHMHESLQDWSQNVFKYPLFQYILYKELFLSIIYARPLTR